MSHKLKLIEATSRRRREKFLRDEGKLSALFVLGILLLFTPMQAFPEGAVSAPVVTREGAVIQARSGDPKGALLVLKDLVSKYADDPRLLADAIIVANWAGEDSYVLDLYAKPQTPKDDVGVIEAAAHSARNLHRYDLALSSFARAQQLAPDRWQPQLGYALVLVDQEHYSQAAKLMKPLLEKNGSEPDVERGQAYLCSRQQDFACAVDMYQKLLVQIPNSQNELQCELAQALSELGGNTLAHSVCTAGDFAGRQQLLAGTGAERVRWSESNDYEWRQRQTDGEQAISLLNGVIASSKPEERIWKQAQSDRLLALSNLDRMEDVVQSWEALQRSQVEVADYARARVAGAYLAMRRPEKAEELFRDLVKRSPEDGSLWSGLAFAEFESEKIRKSFQTIDQAYHNAPAWLQSPDLSVPKPNPFHASLGLQAAEMRGFANMPAEEQRRLQKLLSLAPANSEIGRAMAMTYKARGWPLRAMEQARLANSFDQKDDLPVLEDAEILEAAGRRKESDAVMESVVRRVGNSPAVTKFITERDIGRGWQAAVSSGYERSDGRYLGNSVHSEGFLYTPLMGYRWRAHVHGVGDTGQFTSGSTYRARAAAGFSYDSNRQSFWGEAGTDTSNSGWIPTGAAGARFRLGDQWLLSAEGDWDNVTDIQLITQLADVHARSGSAGLTWRQSDLRSIQGTFTRMRFSDGNQRSEVAASWAQRVLTRPRLQVEFTPQLWASNNSLDQNRIYFNPRNDASLGFNAGLNWVTWRRYDRRLLQQFNVSAAPYWQDHYGFMGAFGADYTQRWALTKRLGIFGRFIWNGHPYDGAREPYTNISFGLTWGEQ